jgi:hypothetical protein
MSATLHLERGMPMAVGDRKRSWQILLNGGAVGEIALGEAFELAIEPGDYTLQLTSTGSRRSPERSFTARDESVVEFNCHVQPIWPLLLMALVIPGRWIALKRR